MADQGELSSRDRTWTEGLFDLVYDLVPGDHLKKREFSDAIRSRYEWTPPSIVTDLLDVGQETGQTIQKPTPWGVFNNLISAGAVAMPGPGKKAKELAKKAVEKVDQFAGPASKWLNELVPFADDLPPNTELATESISNKLSDISDLVEAWPVDATNLGEEHFSYPASELEALPYLNINKDIANALKESKPQDEIGKYLENIGPAISKLYNRGFPTGHISAHDFDKFDISKVLSGEGTIMEGSGIYSTNEPAVLPYYIDQFTKVNYQDLAKDDPQRAALNKVHGYMSSGLDQKSAINAAYIDIGGSGHGSVKLIDYNKDMKEVFNTLGKWRKDGVPKGLIDKPFKYDIHMDADIEKFPQWDAPMGQNPELQNKLLQAYYEHPNVNPYMHPDNPIWDQTNYSELYNEIFGAGIKEAGLKGPMHVAGVRGGSVPTYDPGNKVDIIAKQLVEKHGSIENAYNMLMEQQYDKFEPNLLNDLDETLMKWNDSGISFDKMAKKTPAQVAAETSDYLYKRGIPGHKYLPGEGRFDDVGTRNFVSYHDEFMSIIGKTKLALMLGLPAAALLTDDEAKAYEAENAK